MTRTGCSANSMTLAVSLPPTGLVGRPTLPLRGCAGDLLQAADRVGFPDREADDHHPDQVARGIGVAGATHGYRDHDSKRKPLGQFPAAVEQVPCASRDRRERDVVQLGSVGVGDLPGTFEVRAGQEEAAVLADGAVQRGARRVPLTEEPSQLGGVGPQAAKGGDRASQPRADRGQRGSVAPEVVGEQSP